MIDFIRNKLGAHQDNFSTFKNQKDTDIYNKFKDNPEILYSSILEIAKDLVFSILRKDPFAFSSEDL